ncbi:hypothetical protein EIN_150990 [Entamoeba invadens IP1]|uniref:Furin repeat-containing protein n=1 Tax=Entamoeba invadens IP1 TaxID=370355 RepID=A0A0A1U8Q0_ENTIV|nr:hypothetical protein EIN_150990 [Entamoeba invadens IP1]ELP91222.1 hypothetical protein EIN_150990 [Entamoeba invadens IP1]|eukprot:XP_004257993.1 hypothetical protein EIN_150990 [Entamoeba invadens IP1]
MQQFNCLRVDSDGICTECYGVLYPNRNNNTCVSGNYIEGCLKYNNTETCTLCDDKYYLDDNNTCSKCIDNCSKCTYASQCSVCAPGFYTSFNKQCEECTFNETTNCTSTTPILACSSCNRHCSYNDANSECYEFDSHCQTFFENSDYCETCEMGYGLSYDTKSCYEIPANRCRSTSHNLKGEIVCTECFSGYFLTSSYTCELCSAECKTCVNTSTTCFDCQKNSAPISSMCRLCDVKHCLECSKYSEVCEVCASGYEPSSGYCKESSCIKRNEYNDCLLCQPLTVDALYSLPDDKGRCLNRDDDDNSSAGLMSASIGLLILVLLLL